MKARVIDRQDKQRRSRVGADLHRYGTKEAMLRFALSPDGSVVLDIRRKLPGSWGKGRG